MKVKVTFHYEDFTYMYMYAVVGLVFDVNKSYCSQSDESPCIMNNMLMFKVLVYVGLSLTEAPHFKILTELDPTVLSCYLMTLYFVETLLSQSIIENKNKM